MTGASHKTVAPRVTVVSRTGCHLCEAALRAVEAVPGVGEVAVLDVDGDLGPYAERRAEWSELVPDVLVDGRVHDVIRVDPARLRTALQAPVAPAGDGA